MSDAAGGGPEQAFKWLMVGGLTITLIAVTMATFTEWRPSWSAATATSAAGSGRANPNPSPNVPAVQPHPSWPQPTQMPRREGNATITTTVRPVPKMTAEECRNTYGGSWEPSTSGPNVCRVKK